MLAVTTRDGAASGPGFAATNAVVAGVMPTDRQEAAFGGLKSGSAAALAKNCWNP